MVLFFINLLKFKRPNLRQHGRDTVYDGCGSSVYMPHYHTSNRSTMQDACVQLAIRHTKESHRPALHMAGRRTHTHKHTAVLRRRPRRHNTLPH
jgi:hypothetical protein